MGHLTHLSLTLLRSLEISVDKSHHKVGSLALKLQLYDATYQRLFTCMECIISLLQTDSS